MGVRRGMKGQDWGLFRRKRGNEREGEEGIERLEEEMVSLRLDLQQGSSTDLGLINQMHRDVSRDAFPCFVTPPSCSEIISQVIRKAFADSTSV